MPIEDFTTQQVAEGLKKLETDAKALAKKKADLEAKLSKLSARLREVEAAEKALRRDTERLQTARTLLREVPGDVRGLRGRLAEARKNAVRDDIAVRQAIDFKAEVSRLEKELIAACQHPLIVQHEGYVDHHSADRDEGYPGERACAICDLHEVEYARWGGEGGYKSLVEADHRLFARCPKDDLSVQRTAFVAMRDLKEIVAVFTDKRVLELLASLTRPPTE